MGLPPLSDFLRNLLIGLFVLYALELACRNILGLPVDALVWWPLGSGAFELWQPLSRYLVQGNDLLDVLLAALVLYFFLPAITDRFRTRQLGEVVAAAALGGTALALLLDLLFGLGRPALGWQALTMVPVVLFGLSMPRATVRLFFVLPVPASVFAWGTGAIASLALLAAPGLYTADYLGAWLGVLGWWYGFGPGARRRLLQRKKRSVERELRRFQVLEGGKSDRKSGFGDDTIH